MNVEIDYLRKQGAKRTVLETGEDGHTPSVIEYRLKDKPMGCVWVHRFSFETSSHSIQQEELKNDVAPDQN